MYENMRLRQTCILCLAAMIMVTISGCGEDSIDESKLYKGMDRSGIIARFGAPDARKSHGEVERLTYMDGDNYQYLLLLVDNKLQEWHHDRIFKANRFSNVRGREQYKD